MGLLGNLKGQKGDSGLVANYSVTALKSAANAPDLVFITDSGKEGLFCYDATDTTTADDNLNILVKNDAKRFKRKSDLAFSRLPFVSSIGQLTAFLDVNICQFDGSQWEKKSGNVASNGGTFAGTIVQVNASFYWQRRFESIINVKWFGATGLGVVDETTAINNAKTYTAGYGITTRRGSLFFPKGTYLCNVDMTYQKITIIGEDENGVILSPFDNTKPVLILADDASWDRMTVSNITFKGINLTSIGIQFGHIPYQSNDEYSGRTNIKHCKFINFDKCISRTSGNIGIYIANCTFTTANYHLWGQPNANMQVGVTHVLNSHFDSAKLASIYIASTSTGDGQFILTNCVHEINQGFVLFVGSYSQSEFVPEITFENCWNEVNATATSVVIGGVTYTPQFAYLKNVSNISFINSPVSTLTLINSNCFLDRSDITYMVVTKDNQSLLQIDNAIMESAHTHEFVRTIKSSIRVAGGYSSYFTPYHRNILNKIYTSNIKTSIPFNTTFQFSGSSTRNTVSVPNDGTTYNNCESILINQGDTFVNPTSMTMVTGKYYVYTLAYKLISGLQISFQLTGSFTVNPNIKLNSTKWETIYGLVSTYDATPLPGSVSMYLTPGISGSSTVNLGGFQLLEFDNKQDAMNFLESRTFAN